MIDIKAADLKVIANGIVSFFDKTKPISLKVEADEISPFTVNFLLHEATKEELQSGMVPKATREQEVLAVEIPVDPTQRIVGSTKSPVEYGQQNDHSIYFHFRVEIIQPDHVILSFTFYAKKLRVNSVPKNTQVKNDEKK